MNHRYYQIEPLVRAYSIFSESYLKIDSVNVLLASALQFDLRESVERCESFILRNGSQTLLNPTFEAVPEHEVCRLLSFDTLEILEVEAFLAAVKWGKARFPQDSSAALKMRLSNIMQYVRFPLMDSKDMAETVEPLGLVDEQLILEAYRFKATGGDSSSRSHEANQFRRFIPRRPPADHNQPPRQSYALPSLNSTLPRQSTWGGGGGSAGGVDSLSFVAMKESFRASSRASSRTGYAAAAPTSGPPGGAMVGVGLGLSLHSSLPCMVVTEVAAWCLVQGGDLITIEVGDLLNSIDGWAIVRNVDEVKRHLLGPPGTSVNLGIQVCHHSDRSAGRAPCALRLKLLLAGGRMWSLREICHDQKTSTLSLPSFILTRVFVDCVCGRGADKITRRSLSEARRIACPAGVRRG